MAIAMTDRLYLLKGRGSAYDPMERSDTGGFEDDSDLNGILSTVDDVTGKINRVVTLIEKVKANHAKILTSFTNQAAREDNEQMNEEIKSMTRGIHNQLKKMKATLEAEESGPNRNTADFRIRKAQYSTLSRRFKDVMEDYNSVQESYRDKNKERIQKQLQYAGRTVTEEKLDEMLESGDPQIFTQDILLETAQKRAVLGEVEARHKEILQLESNIRELHDMFLDMAMLVDEQGEMINVIERNVENATVYTYHAQKEVKKAVVYKRKNTKLRWAICCCTCCVALLLLMIAVIIVVLIYFLAGIPGFSPGSLGVGGGGGGPAGSGGGSPT